MADGSGPGRVTLSGVVLAALLLILIIASLYLFVAKPYWFPVLASVHGGSIDSLFGTVLVVSGIVFIIVQGMLGLYFVDAPADALVIQVTGEQFSWNFHYPGPDGAFGRTDPKMITSANNIGLDRSDPPAKDDIVSVGEMHVLAGRPVKVRIRSKDVIHSFFLPNLRVKQDAVPGMAIEVWFTPNRPGAYEIACAELCGLGHYRMRGFLTIDDSQDNFNKWLQQKAAEQ